MLDRAHFTAAVRAAGTDAASQPDLDHALDLLEALAADWTAPVHEPALHLVASAYGSWR